MTRTNRILLAILVVQIGIIAASRLLSHDHESAFKPKLLFSGIDTTDITGITIVDDDKSVRLKREGDAWVLASGGNYPTDETKVKDLLSKFPGLRATAPVATDSRYHRKLEVAEGENQRQITLNFKDGKTRRFFLGSSPGLKKVHFRFADESEVYSVSGLSSWDVGATASNWINTAYVKLDKDNVVALSLKNEHGELNLDKSSGQWVLAGLKPEEELKTSTATALVNSASAIHLKDPVGKSPNGNYGFGTPTAVLTVVMTTKKDKEPQSTAGEAKKDPETTPVAQSPAADDSKKTVIVTFGKKDGDIYFAKSSESPYVVKIASWNAETFVNKKRADLIKEKATAEKNNPAPPNMPVPSKAHAAQAIPPFSPTPTDG